MTAATVTTLRNAGPVIESFVAYHRAIGFSHIFLYFDDPADPALEWARAQKDVTAIAHDSALRQAWAGLTSYMGHMSYIDREVQSRQILNAEHAMNLARQMGLKWLLHIDIDELFFTPKGDAASHYIWLDRSPFDTVVYPNFEAIPEQEESDDFFREVTLFKKAASMHPTFTDEVEALVQRTPQLRPDFFHFYDNGKSAVRLASPGMIPASPHHFARPGAFSKGQSPEQVILHYACCGFETLWQKYVTLGNFGDKWWDKFDIRALSMGFHLDARDVVMAGDREAARRFYRERLMMKDPALIAILEHHRLVTRISGPKTLLASL